MTPSTRDSNRSRRRRKGGRGSRPSKPAGNGLFAAIDLGSNNCRLLIARPTDDGNFQVVDSFSRIVRLGEGVALTGALAPEAIERTVAALKICGARVRKSGAAHIRAIATEACRRARNADVLVERVRKEAGLCLDIVSPEEEARLAAVGCAPLLDPRYEVALVFDIGGGSTEIIWLRREDEVLSVMHSASLPLGVVSIAEGNNAARMDRRWYEEIRDGMIGRFLEVREAMSAKHAFEPEANHLLGTSGTVTTLAGIALGLERYSRARVDASWHDCRDILEVIDRLAALDIAGRAGVGCIGPERADLVLAGCAIFGAIHTLWPCAQLRVADRGLREGMLRELMREARA